MKKKLMLLVILILLPINAMSFIRGHKWGDSIDKVKNQEIKLGSVIGSIEKRELTEMKVTGKVGGIDTEFIFFFHNSKLVEIRIIPSYNSAEAFYEAIKKKYNIIIRNRIKSTDSFNIYSFTGYSFDLIKNIDIDKLHKKVSFKYAGNYSNRGYFFLLPTMKTYIQLELSPATGSYFTYTSSFHFDNFLKRIKLLAKKEQEKLLKLRTIKEDL